MNSFGLNIEFKVHNSTILWNKANKCCNVLPIPEKVGDSKVFGFQSWRSRGDNAMARKAWLGV